LGAKRADGTAIITPLREQHGRIGRHHARRRAGAGADRPEQMLLEELGGDVLAQRRLGDIALGEHLAEHRLAEIARRVDKGRVAGDLGIDERLGHAHAVLFAIGDERLGRNQLVRDTAQAAIGEELVHGQCRLFLALALEHHLRAALQLGGGQRLAADAGDLAGRRAEHAEPAGAGHVAGDEGERDQPQEHRRKDAAELGSQETPEDLHVVMSRSCRAVRRGTL
jgi:hypothetical protein